MQGKNNFFKARIVLLAVLIVLIVAWAILLLEKGVAALIGTLIVKLGAWLIIWLISYGLWRAFKKRPGLLLLIFSILLLLESGLSFGAEYFEAKSNRILEEAQQR